MHFLYLPYLRRIFNVLQLGGLVLLSSCQSDPIVLNPPGGYEFKSRSFQIDTSNIFSIQGDHHTGHSPKLYSGILSLTNSLEDTASVLIRILPELLDTHQVCNNPDSISKVNISLTSITPLAEDDTSFLIQKNELKIYLLPQDHLSENWDENVIIDTTDIITIFNDLNGYTPLHDSLIYIENHSIEIQLYDFDNTIIDNWCENEIAFHTGILILYTPDISTLNPEDSRFIEFVSSDADVSLMPRLNLEYHVKTESPITENIYSISSVESSHESLIKPFYINNEATELWGTVYAINIENSENDSPILEESLDLESITISEEIISSTQLDSAIHLVEIEIILNAEIQDSIEEISFWLNNVEAFISGNDPSGDNWNEIDSTLTEGNGQLDWSDDNDNEQWNAGEGEEWFDFGEDNCPDIWETGIEDTPCDSLNSSYNPEGTEGNNELNWEDEDDDGIWMDGIDSGEKWMDVGVDGCPDIFESGNSDNPCLEIENEYLAGTDPNGDNFIVDPMGDDWDSATNPPNPLETEMNGYWNENEPFYDFGVDGLPASITGFFDADSSEANGEYDEGEPFDDTGSDGKFSTEEDGYNINGTENNKQFDSEGEYNDCGEDNCCDSDDDLGICDDVANDNYNIDPNADNWNAEDSTSTGTEGNGQLDWTDNITNNQWDVGEGENWLDWGLDGVPDSLEAFQSFLIIDPILYNNLYQINLDDMDIELTTPDLSSDTVSLWISDIQKNEELLSIQVSIQSHIALKGLQFQLYHTPYTGVDTILQTYQPSITSIGDNKLFEDFTLFPRFEYLQTELDSTLRIEYANDLFTFIDFDSLNIFLEKEEYTFSDQYSKLVMYIDTIQSNIHDEGMWLFLGYTDTDSIYTYIPSSVDSIEFPVGQIMAGFQNGINGFYNELKLMTNSSLYNYSTLSILINPGQPDKNPRLDIMYTQLNE